MGKISCTLLLFTLLPRTQGSLSDSRANHASRADSSTSPTRARTLSATSSRLEFPVQRHAYHLGPDGPRPWPPFLDRTRRFWYLESGRSVDRGNWMDSACIIFWLCACNLVTTGGLL